LINILVIYFCFSGGEGSRLSRLSARARKRKSDKLHPELIAVYYTPTAQPLKAVHDMLV